MLFLSSSTSGDLDLGNLTNIRIIRMLRIVRLSRCLRIGRLVQFVSALRTFIYSVLATMTSLLWTLVLLVMIMYVFGTIFTQSCIDYLVADSPNDPRFKEFWGGLPASMFTLFKAISGGVSWHDVL